MTQSGMFEIEIRPGALQSSVRQTRAQQEYQRYKPRATDYVPILFLLSEIFVDCMFVE